MKLLIILSLCVAVMAQKKMSDLNDDLVKQYITDCAKLTNLNPDDIINQNPKLKVENQDQLDCFGACMDKKVNLLDADGKFNMEEFLSYATNETMKNEMREKVKDILEKCKEHENNPCKYSACFRKEGEALQLRMNA